MGSYSVTGPNASGLVLKVHGLRGTSGAVLPKDFTAQQLVDLTADTTVNVAPAAVSTTVSLIDSLGQVPVAPLTANFAYGNTAGFTGPGGVIYKYFSWATESTASDGAGHITFIGFPNATYDISTNADTINGYSAVAYSGNPYSFSTTNKTQTITIPTNRKVFSGTIKVRRNNVDTPLPNAPITISNYPNNWTTTTDSLGNFSFTVAGINAYTVYYGSTSSVDPLVPNGVSLSFALNMTSAHTGVTLPIPIASFAVFSIDSEKRPMPGTINTQITASGNIGSPFSGAGQLSAYIAYNQADTGTNNYYHERWGVPGLTNTIMATSSDSAFGNTNGSIVLNAITGGSVNLVFPFSTSTPSLTFAGSGSSKPQLLFGGGATTNCKIWRNGVQIDTVTGTSYTDNSAQPNVNYFYQVSCLDSYGLESLKSNVYRSVYTGI